MQVPKLTKIFLRMFSRVKKLLIETLIEQIKPLVMGDK